MASSRLRTALALSVTLAVRLELKLNKCHHIVNVQKAKRS